MRLIGSLNSDKQANTFSAYLTQKGIEHILEGDRNNDWGSDNFGQANYNIWVVNEEQWEQSKTDFDAFKINPDSPIFTIEKYPELNPLQSPSLDMLKQARLKLANSTIRSGRIQGSAIITLYILLFCSMLFFWTSFNEKHISNTPSFLPPLAIDSSPLKKALLYDYPDTFRLADKLVQDFGIEKLKKPSELPADGKALLDQMISTPYWKGIYYEIVKHPNLEAFTSYQGQLFERIKVGEWWRLFTPILLHADIFHILFNMIWLMILGPQVETRLGKWRYLLFILITAAFSNTAQYLMGGSNFVGYSGVICGLLAFIWIRQRRAPWEGYLLHPSTIIFISIFIFSMLGLQIISFFLEIYQNFSLTPGIANTAHLAGGFIGYLLGRIKFFSVKTFN